jgi:hypothetical protein
MTKVALSSNFPVAADDIWKLIGGFNGLPEWHPAIKASSLEEGGRVRKLELAGGGSITERLESFSDKEHVYSYSIVQGPLPVAEYVSTLKVRKAEDGKGATVEWSSEFKPKGASDTDASKVIEGIYKAGFDNLRKMLGG